MPLADGLTDGKRRRARVMKVFPTCLYMHHLHRVQNGIPLVTGEYIRSGDPYIFNAMDKLRQLNDYARQTEHGHNFTAQAPHAQRHEITLQAPHELRRRSAKPREYWHADTILLGKTWNHMKQALIMVDDYSCMSFIYLMKDGTLHTVVADLEEIFFRQRPVDTNN